MTRCIQGLLGITLITWLGCACAAPPPTSAPAIPAAASSAALPASASSVGTAGMPSLADIQTFTRAFELIKQAYVEPVDNRQLMQAAVRGMLSGLDPHSAFLDKSDLRDLTDDTSGAYSGLGIEIAQANHQLVIIAPLDGGPAKAAGMAERGSGAGVREELGSGLVLPHLAPRNPADRRVMQPEARELGSRGSWGQVLFCHTEPGSAGAVVRSCFATSRSAQSG